jgi:hypothetical protein
VVDVFQDLRTNFGPARNQGSRPTCLAFALSDGHAVQRTPSDVLSAEHLFYHSARRMPGWLAHEGVGLNAALTALKADGQCAEVGWPYLNALPANLAHWIPPATAAPVFKRLSEVLSACVDDVVAGLTFGRPAILTMLLGERFFTPVNGRLAGRRRCGRGLSRGGGGRPRKRRQRARDPRAQQLGHDMGRRWARMDKRDVYAAPAS